MSSDATYDVLLIEDDPYKQDLIETTINGIRRDAVITLARSVHQAVQQMRVGPYNLIVLDIDLPSHEGRPGGAQPISQTSGGVELLLELSYYERDDPVVIVTQYPEIEFDDRQIPLAKFRQEIASSVTVNIVDVIYFSARDVVWRQRLGKVLA